MCLLLWIVPVGIGERCYPAVNIGYGAGAGAGAGKVPWLSEVSIQVSVIGSISQINGFR